MENVLLEINIKKSGYKKDLLWAGLFLHLIDL